MMNRYSCLITLMVCCHLTHQAREGSLPEQQICALLVLADLH